MSKLEVYKARQAARRSRERTAAARTTDVLIEGGGMVVGAVAAGRVALPTVTLMGMEVDSGLAALPVAFALEMSGMTDKGIAAAGVSAALKGFGSGRIAIAQQNAG